MCLTIADMIDIRKPKELYFLGIQIQQPWTNLFLLEDILNKEPGIKRIVELGTGHGALTTFFALHMYGRGSVLTYDINDTISNRLQSLWGSLPIIAYHLDILTETAQDIVRSFIKHDRSIIFCDAGERDIRPKQFEIYSKLLKPNDLIIQHDYHNSLTPENVRDVQKIVPLEFYRQEDFKTLQTYTVALRRI